MGWIEKVAKRFAKTASIAVTDTVKTEAKHVASSLLPIVVGIVGAVAGVSVYKSSSGKLSARQKRLPTMSTTTTTTNNFFFGEDMAREAFDRVVKK